MTMETDKKTLGTLTGLILFGIICICFYSAGLFSGPWGVTDPPAQTGAIPTTAAMQADNAIITVNPIPEYTAGDTVSISGTTTLPGGDVLDIAMIKEPYHSTKCEPGKFCGSGTYVTTVLPGREGNVWSLALNTTGFSEGGYDIWVMARNNPNTSVHTGLNLRKA
jgi:hypothetical protein